MRVADLIGISIAGLIMAVIGSSTWLMVTDDGLAKTGLIIAMIGGTITAFGLVALAVFAGVKAARSD